MKLHYFESDPPCCDQKRKLDYHKKVPSEPQSCFIDSAANKQDEYFSFADHYPLQAGRRLKNQPRR